MSAHPASLAHNQASVRRYNGEYEAHTHGHAQILVGLTGRLDLEIGGRCAYVDASCGVVIPAGWIHGFMSRALAQVIVVDAPAHARLQRLKRFSVTPRIAAMACLPQAADAIVETASQVPAILARRGLDLGRLDAELARALHQDWTTERMAKLCQFSPQRFHARLLELTGRTPQQYLRERRLAKAQAALCLGQTLEATAMLVGYRSAGALAYALRRDRQFGVRGLRA